MADLRTDFVDDNIAGGGRRKYRMIQNEDGTVSFDDVTNYAQVGTQLSANDLNAICAEVNALNGKIIDSGWQNLSDNINGATGEVFVRTIGKVCYVSMELLNIENEALVHDHVFVTGLAFTDVNIHLTLGAETKNIAVAIVQNTNSLRVWYPADLTGVTRIDATFSYPCR